MTTPKGRAIKTHLSGKEMTRPIESEPRPTTQEDRWISLKFLQLKLVNLLIPTPLRERIMDGAEKQAKSGVIAEVDPSVADEYLREVAQKVFGFSVSDLSAMELREIEGIRKNLRIPGDFDPSA